MRRPVFLAILLGWLPTAQIASAQTLPVITVTTNTPVVSEPNGMAAFVIFKDGDSDVTVHFEMAGTAVSGVDYVIIGGGSSVVVPGKTNVAVVQIQVLDDLAVEPDETITLNVLPDPAYAISKNGSATIKLRSNDPDNLPTYPPPGDISIDLGPSLPKEFQPLIVAAQSQVTATARAGSGYPATATLYLDGQRIGNMQRHVFEVSSSFTSPFVSPTTGLHTVTAVATDPRGAAGAGSLKFRVADALMNATSIGVISNSALVSSLPGTNAIYTPIRRS